jgi:hypothetical protein
MSEVLQMKTERLEQQLARTVQDVERLRQYAEQLHDIAWQLYGHLQEHFPELEIPALTAIPMVKDEDASP